MKKLNVNNLVIIVISTLLILGCKKYLDVKPDKSLVVPTSLTDLQNLLNNTDIMNSSNPVIQEGATDNSYIIPTTWEGLTEISSKNMYIFNEDIFNDNEINEWSMSYVTVFYSNVVLEQLDKIKPVPPEANRIKGEALFFRSFAFYQLAQLFAKPYDLATAEQDWGIPLKLKSDIAEKSSRSSVKQTYDQIIKDLKLSAELLPTTSNFKTTPTKQAAFGLLARFFLSMGEYEKASFFADNCLKIYDSLIDFNDLTLSAAYPLPKFNKEVIFHSTGFGRTILSVTYGRVDQTLYDLYRVNDLRKIGFFRDRIGTISFKGSYNGTSSLFNGISTNEVLLIRAECQVRIGNLQNAIDDINALAKNRYSKLSFQPFNTTSKVEALDHILEERRKELLFRGLRWTDLRRLNKEARYAKVVTHKLGEKSFELPPNDNKYVLPIPKSVILNTGMEQNPQ
jgi:hypothetical protein